MSFYKNIPGYQMPISNEQLLQQMAKGDRQSFTELYNRYWEQLFITAAKALRGKEEAADVVQDVFLSLWDRRNELNLLGSLSAYLHTSVRYKCIHYIEKNITRHDYLVHLIVSESPSSAETNLQLKEVQQLINNTVSKMPPKMQEVYRMSRQQQLSYKEIAEKMRVSVETVKKHIHHALHLIKKDLQLHTTLLPFLLFFCLS